jgi:hypothetical protein
MAAFAAPSFHDGNGSVADGACAIAEAKANGANYAVSAASSTRRLMWKLMLASFLLTKSINLRMGALPNCFSKDGRSLLGWGARHSGLKTCRL